MSLKSRYCPALLRHSLNPLAALPTFSREVTFIRPSQQFHTDQWSTWVKIATDILLSYDITKIWARDKSGRCPWSVDRARTRTIWSKPISPPARLPDSTSLNRTHWRTRSSRRNVPACYKKNAPHSWTIGPNNFSSHSHKFSPDAVRQNLTPTQNNNVTWHSMLLYSQG